MAKIRRKRTSTGISDDCGANARRPRISRKPQATRDIIHTFDCSLNSVDDSFGWPCLLSGVKYYWKPPFTASKMSKTRSLLHVFIIFASIYFMFKLRFGRNIHSQLSMSCDQWVMLQYGVIRHRLPQIDHNPMVVNMFRMRGRLPFSHITVITAVKFLRLRNRT